MLRVMRKVETWRGSLEIKEEITTEYRILQKINRHFDESTSMYYAPQVKVISYIPRFFSFLKCKEEVTWDYWKVITEFLPKLKDEIMNRKGGFPIDRVVIRPDSGNPVDIICGDVGPWNVTDYEFKQKNNNWDCHQRGTYEMLWETFGGTINEQGYKVLDSHIGLIYGDSITFERQKEILKRLEAKGFSASNLVLGIGSYTYQYVTRDSYGTAVKATYGEVDGVGRNIFKDPKTDDGMKKSAKGLLAVIKPEGGTELQLEDELSIEEYHNEFPDNLLELVWKDGKFYREQTLQEIRDIVKEEF